MSDDAMGTVHHINERRIKANEEKNERDVTVTVTMKEREWCELFHCIDFKQQWIEENAEELINDHGDPSFPEWWIDTLAGAEGKLGEALFDADVML